MKILMIGGTRFVGRHMTEAALKRGHDITLFHRGKTNPDVFPQVEHVYGDRDGQLEALKNRTWDVVIDTSGYVPRVVRQSVELLKEAVNRYIFISTISVYRDLETKAHEDENGALQTLSDETTEVITGETYGALKALCEKVVLDTLPTLIIRPGLVVGPEDYTLRFTYWPMRVFYGGQMLIPPEFKMQFIDARDLAEWTIQMAEQQQTGIFNATGQPVPLSDVLETSRILTGKEVQFVPVSEAFLQENEVSLPLWFPSSVVGVHTINVNRALNAGLQFHPLTDTIRDTLADGQQQENPLRAGLSLEQEAKLLQKWLTAKS